MAGARAYYGESMTSFEICDTLCDFASLTGLVERLMHITAIVEHGECHPPTGGSCETLLRFSENDN